MRFPSIYDSAARCAIEEFGQNLIILFHKVIFLLHLSNELQDFYKSFLQNFTSARDGIQ